MAANPLEDLFRSGLRCPAGEAQALAAAARLRVPRLAGGADDTEEDLVFRLGDPRTFGEFAAPLLRDEGLGRATRAALAERAFDLLDLPRHEGDVFAVETRAPPHLLAIADFLGTSESFTILHALHLVYSVFLDRGLVAAVDRGTRERVLHRVLAEGGANSGLRVLYACMHLAAVPSKEALETAALVLDDGGLDLPVRRSLAETAAAEDGGASRLRRTAQDEGLLPRSPGGTDDLAVIANVPRIPGAVAAVARAWLAEDAGRRPPGP